AFMDYTASFLFETTPGYRTDYYREFAYDLIKRMNTTIEDWGNDSIEYKEWSHPSYSYDEHYYPNDPEAPSTIFTGGFRGPANIMWTAHYALMMSLYERSFNTGEMTDEITWYIDDWENSLTTDGFGNPQAGGIWETGLIPCEPYIVFVQCNTIPLTATRLYDNMYDTTYYDDGMWDYGIDFMNTVMQDEYSLFMDGYYVDAPMAALYESTRYNAIPGPALSQYSSTAQCKVSSYCDGWALAFFEYTQPEETRNDYPIFLEHFMKDVDQDMAYIIDTYNNPGGFGVYDILGTLFTMQLAKQLGDYSTRDRIAEFFYSSYNKVWSPDGRTMHYDTTSLEPFFQSVASFGHIWGQAPVSIKDITDARPTDFWNYPFISQADDDSIWIYQAEWDPEKEAFILNIGVDQQATLVFSNFDSVPTAYASGISLGELTAIGSDYALTLSPGNYQIVIM
ncbi:MAG: linalool dehydratase/isomerase domain-containing protein, partial [Candidatus Thorarchaeota archaeon]